jgi:serine/threonine protein kinase
MNERSLFLDALEIDDPARRTAFLDEACGTDLSLRLRLDQLLESHAQAGQFLAKPVQERPCDYPTVDAETVTAGPARCIGPYKLLQEIGAGGMGTVFLAEQQQPIRRSVAVKVIKPGMDSQQVIARFEAERQALALMEHPNIAHVLEAGSTEAGRPYFVMELVKGVPITAYCDEQRLTPRQRLELFVPVCQAVQHAHQKGVIHRDLKPSNVLVAEYDDRAVPKIIDFGIAKAVAQRLTERTLVTGFGHLVGTLEYMSPEQAKFNALDIDTRSDIYALGVLLYELLTGSPPFDRKRLRDTPLDESLRIIREEEPPRPSTHLSCGDTLPAIAAKRGTEPAKLGKLLRGDLDWIVMKALDKERARRYQTADSLARDIQHYLDDEPVAAGPPSARYRLGKFVRRHRRWLAAACAFVLLLVVATAVSVSLAVWAVLAESETSVERDKAVAAKRRAEEEAAMASAVSDFLNNNVLGQASAHLQAGPGRAPDRDLKVRTALDRAADNMHGKFAGQPRVEVAVRLTMGNAYRQLTEYDRAQQQLETALQRAQDAWGEENDDTLHAMNELAVLYQERGKNDLAEPLYARCLALNQKRNGDAHASTLRCQTNLASLYQAQGKYAQAEPLLQAALAGQRQLLGEEHEMTLASINNLALLYQAQGKFVDAEPLLLLLIERRRRLLGHEHPATLEAMGNLAGLYQEANRLDEAEPLLDRVFELSRKVHGDDHSSTLTAMNNLAVYYCNRKQYERAEPLFTKGLATQRQKLGNEHPHTLFLMNNLALVLQRRGEFARAEVLSLEALQVCRKILGPEHIDTALTINNLAWLYRAQKKFAEAEPLYVQGLAVYRQVKGDDHPDTLTVLRSLASFYYQEVKRYDKAEPLYTELLERYRRLDGKDSARVGAALASLGVMQVRQGKHQEAEPQLRAALAIYKKTVPDTWHVGFAQVWLGASLAGQQKYADAEPVLLAGYERLQARHREMPNPGPQLAEAGEQLVRLYEAWGKNDKADQWRKKAAAPN